MERSDRIHHGIVGKRLTYQQSSSEGGGEVRREAQILAERDNSAMFANARQSSCNLVPQARLVAVRAIERSTADGSFPDMRKLGEWRDEVRQNCSSEAVPRNHTLSSGAGSCPYHSQSATTW